MGLISCLAGMKIKKAMHEHSNKKAKTVTFKADNLSTSINDFLYRD